MIHRAAALALFLALGGCSYPPYYLARTPAAEPVTPNVDHAQGFFQGAGGLRLFEQSWRPRFAPRASFVIVHGLKDHSSRYAAFAEQLVREGYAVHAFDLRGHGRSEGMRVWVDSFEQYLDDVDVFLKRVRAREGGGPVYLFGHSMGGAIVTLYAIERRPALAGVVLSAAALERDVSPFTVAGNTVIDAFEPKAGVFNLDLHDFSRDPAVVQSGLSDPLVYQGGAPAHTAKELLHAIGTIGDRMEDAALPLLILHGTADRVTPPAGSQELARRARASDKTLELYPGLYHDLLHEPENARVAHDIIAWLDARTRGNAGQ